MILACCQHDIFWEDKAATHARVRALLDGAALPKGSLVLLPEMFSTGFSMNVAQIAEGQERATETFLASEARARGVSILAGVVSSSSGRGRNEALLMGPDGREQARYAKLHPFSFGGEDRHFEAGRSLCTFEWQGIKVAPFICYDLRFPEAFRAAVDLGAELLVVIASWPLARAAHWVALLRARAIENQAYVAGVNRCGDDPKLAYGGRSLIIDPRGEVLAEAGDAECVLTAPIDHASLVAYRSEFPALKDRRFSIRLADGA
jgi:omega-amidase